MKKQVKDLTPGDRIQFNSLELLTNDGHPCSLQSEVIRLQPLYFHGSVAILTTSGFLAPVNESKEFELVEEGDYDPTATQVAYTVPPAETHEGKSLE